MAKKDEEKTDVEAGAQTDVVDSPLLDMTDAAVKKMIKAAKKRGFVTYSELNAVLPSEEVSSDQIEDVYAMLSEMGITVTESEDQEEGEGEGAADEEESEGGELVEEIENGGGRLRRIAGHVHEALGDEEAEPP